MKFQWLARYKTPRIQTLSLSMIALEKIYQQLEMIPRQMRGFWYEN